MRVISGAGEFELAVERIEVRDEAVALVGKMGVWDSETFLTVDELAQILRASLNRPTLWFVARRFPPALVRSLWRTARKERDDSRR